MINTKVENGYIGTRLLLSRLEYRNVKTKNSDPNIGVLFGGYFEKHRFVVCILIRQIFENLGYFYIPTSGVLSNSN